MGPAAEFPDTRATVRLKYGPVALAHQAAQKRADTTAAFRKAPALGLRGADQHSPEQPAYRHLEAVLGR